MPPISPWSNASAFGSVFSDAPGPLRENGYTFQYTFNPSATAMSVPVCSGEASPVNSEGVLQTVLPALGAGDVLSIYGIQACAATTGAPLIFGLRVGSDSNSATSTDPQLIVVGANARGPWFQSFELPIQIHGVAGATGTEVWVDVIQESGAGANIGLDRGTLNCILTKAPF